MNRLKCLNHAFDGRKRSIEIRGSIRTETMNGKKFGNANGGLIILPKLLRHLKHRMLSAEAFVRCHYLVSIALVNVSLLTLLLYPFEQAMRSPWLPVAAVSYFWLYTRDLVHVGYSSGDIFRVFAASAARFFGSAAPPEPEVGKSRI